jgi:TonB family protein
VLRLSRRGVLNTMSSTSFDSEEFRRAHERRRLPRLRLPSLAYVDVDSDNGGILLNLSETGLALQAVAPFSDLTRVTLRIQPPKPRQTLDLHAKIVWLSESKKEAGLEFLELEDHLRTEIKNWISAEGGAPESRASGESAAPPIPQFSPAPFPQEAPTAGRKWPRSPENSPSLDAPSNQNISRELPSPSIAGGNFEQHATAILREQPVIVPVQKPAPSDEKIHAPTSSPIERPVEPIVFSQQVSPAAPSPSQEIPPPEEGTPRRRKWSFLLKNSPAQDAPIQNTPSEIPRRAVGSTYIERLTDAILHANSVDVSPKNPIATNEQIHARTRSTAELPSDQIVSSEKVSAAAPSPSIEMSPPPPPFPPAAASTAHSLQPPPAPVALPLVQTPSTPADELIATRDQTPKTFIPSVFEEFPRSGDRRRLPRRRIGSLAYLDIGSDNGGMVLDLTENGLALQAFNPLIGQTRLSLRIQPPISRKRIVATAEISWLSDSKTEAGLKFLELSEDARMEIAEWLATETSVPEHPPVHDPAARETPQLSSATAAPQDSEERDRVCEEWFPLLGDLNPKESLAHHDELGELLRTSTGSENFASQPGFARSEKSSNHLTRNPEADQSTSRPRASNVSKAAVSPPAPSVPVPDVRSSPLKSPGPLAPRSRPYLSEQSRKWGTIAALCACVALVFLLLGMAISRGLLSDRATKLSAEEKARDAAASSSTPATQDAMAGPAAFPADGSASKTRPAASADVSRAPQMEIREKHSRENPKSRARSGEADATAAALPPAIAPAPETVERDAQTATVPSLPVWSVQAAANPNRPVGGLATNPAPLRVPERRSDCYLLYRVEPLYPREAREQRIEGTVMVHLQIGTDGRVKGSRELSGPAPLVPAALAAVREWRFIPALLNGQPVDTEKDVSIEFQLSR